MTREFYSNGKLLLSGEYAVLDGALAWAIPTKYGQNLKVSTNNTSTLTWRSFDEKDALWFEASFDLATLKPISFSDQSTTDALQQIFKAAKKLNADFLTDASGYAVQTALTFPKNWGLGSSSTLINNVANWAGISAQELLSKTFGGSGYDIACAQHNKPILYQRNAQPTVSEVDFNLPFSNALYFVYLNQKMNSRDAIAAYRERVFDKDKLINELTQITQKMSVCGSLKDFEQLINQHELALSKALAVATVKTKLFSDYTGAIKSLGGWGGDFILATGDAQTPAYFKNKGYHTVIPFAEMIL